MLLLAYKNGRAHGSIKLSEGLISKKIGASILQTKMT